jgi:putative colanic acid biosynthesis glycosyltransferase WcaI
VPATPPTRRSAGGSDATPGRRPRLLVFNQYYWPGIEATARLLADLCATLAQDYDVTVVTGSLRQADSARGRSMHDGVTIIRVASTIFDRRRLSLRAINYISYLAQSLRAGLMSPRPDAVLCMTDPPVIANVGLIVARRFRVPLVVISQDVFPEIAVELRRLENPVLLKLLGACIRFYLTRADRIVAIGETMRARLEQKGALASRLRVIPNWVDTSEIRPAPRNNEWSHEHGLDDKFVVMHSGNVGFAQNLELLVRAASFLRDLDDLAVVIIGMGARHHVLVELARVLEVDQVVFLPYQERSDLTLSLSAADVHYVGLSPGLAGYVVPSRLYGVLAAGKPVIAAADAQSETALLVEAVGCGVVVPPSRAELLAAAIRDARSGILNLEAMGERARAFALSEATREVAFARYRALFSELIGTTATG